MTKYRLFVGTLLAAAVLATGCQGAPEPARSVGSVPSEATQVSGPVPAVYSNATQVSGGAARQPHTEPATSSSQAPTTAARSPRPSDPYDGFSLVVGTSAGNIEAPIAPLSVDVGSDGTAAPIDPPHDTAQQWRTAAWIEQSAYPTSAAAGGPTYIYGHACHHHVCSFTRLRDAATGNTVTVDTPASMLTYRICATGRSAKTGNLQVPTCRAEPVNLVLVTCEYEQGDQSTHNLVVAAHLVSSRSR